MSHAAWLITLVIPFHIVLRRQAACRLRRKNPKVRAGLSPALEMWSWPHFPNDVGSNFHLKAVDVSIPLLGCAAHCVNNLVIRLCIVQPRLHQQCLSIQFLRCAHVGL